MVTINENIPGTLTINVSFNQTITKVALNELKSKFGFSNPLMQMKTSILDSISREIDNALDGKFKIDDRQILHD